VTPIPQHLLVAASPLGPGLSAAWVATAIARGIEAAGRPEPDLCEIASADDAPGDVRETLDALGFGVRMRSARAVVIAVERLEERSLAGSLAFEIASRARQGGVPAYAVTAANRLAAFDARILDLQLILEARTAKALSPASRKLAELA
jgi:hypothetical protein